MSETLRNPWGGVRRRDIERALERAERAVALLERCRPTNAASEQARIAEAWRAGREAAPDWSYRPAAHLSELRTGLETLAEHARELGPWGVFYADRARELALEAELAEQVGLPEFRQRAARRFPVDGGDDALTANTWAEDWLANPPAPSEQASVPTDDERDPDSLLSAMRRAVGAHRLPFRVVVRHDLLSAAATGNGVIVIRGGARLRAFEVERIVLHEIHGHALPRARARHEPLGLFAVGTAGGSDDEEGRALLLERRAACLGRHRRAELARRHLAATAVRAGADWTETVRLLRGTGSTTEEALAIAARAHRGGGLGREIVYLIALARVSRAFEADPSLESWLERGRIAVHAVPILRRLGDPPELFPIPRAA